MTITIRSIRRRDGLGWLVRGFLPSGQEFIRGESPEQIEAWVARNRPAWTTVRSLEAGLLPPARIGRPAAARPETAS